MSYEVSGLGSYGKNVFAQAAVLSKADMTGDEAVKETESREIGKQEGVSLEISDIGKSMNDLAEKNTAAEKNPVDEQNTAAGKNPVDEKDAAAKKDETESETRGGSVAVNEGKRARQIAAAQSMSDIQMVMGLLTKDLADCQSGEAQGMCDKSEIDKVKALMQKAQQKMAELSGGDSKQQSEEGFDAFSLNLLM